MPKLPFGGGSGSDNIGYPQEDGAPANRSEGLTSTQGDLVRAKIAQDIESHQKNRGDVPGQWGRFLEEYGKPLLDWRRELQYHVRRAVEYAAGMADYTYSRPSRRQSIYGDIIMPSLRSPRPNIAIGIDTSGSMSSGDLSAAMGEVSGILEQTGIRGTPVVAIDAQVQKVQRVTSASQVKSSGEGGTDMGKAIEHFNAATPRPDVLIILTDMWTPWPDEPAPYTVIACAIGDESDSYECPSWIKVVNVPTNQER